ncbi:Trans-aconitate 2-methyltransferase [Penicillium argentinense]|uniref:Trans-aconitate 2-methyltransferase n=1 Tax=Penicillium argentinense TaxID=1131581 RepID=A0A9W9FHC8_9EURO|nr:Trans-aconitate 2-methyltransferase [Penicillium argentinense]KAJ5100149.1 Trans-aconitate 2-methyltransferase [Penicillium argentinense]
MIRKAKTVLLHRKFSVEDLRSYSPEGSVDLFFSNAVFQCLDKDERFSIIKKLIETQLSGGVFAL